MKKQDEKFFIGTSGWSYDSWKGLFYPRDIVKSRWFEYYASKFNTVEINATFYRFFKDQTYNKWYENAPDTFRYVLKAPKLITHRKYLENIEYTIHEFYRSASILDNKFGLILLQLAPQTPYDPKRLSNALLTFKNPKKIAVEFRDTKWFTEEIKNLLKSAGSAFCSTDSPKIRLMDWVTADTAYIRLHGRKQWYNYNYSLEELQKISELSKRMITLGAKEVYIFFNNDVNAYAPKNALALMEMLGV